jgi:D-serine deaminase-like pyridoxal phosphate-dependent protein
MRPDILGSYPLGKPGSRFEINTPALVLDLDVLERNIATMAKTIDRNGRQLRPHAKSHKCTRIAALQIEAGAVGVCCATLDEAEVMAAADMPGILITSPITATSKMSRLVSLVGNSPGASIVVDDLENVDVLSAAAKTKGVVIPLVIDVDLGFSRTGVTTSQQVSALGRRIISSRHVRFAGVQAYAGHLQHIQDYETRLKQARHAGEMVKGVVKEIEALGVEVSLVSGGGTGTHIIDSAQGPFTEIQAGSYIFMDAEYNAVSYKPNEGWPFDVSLFLQTTVISTNSQESVTVDAGTKAVAFNGPRPLVIGELSPYANFEFAGDEHGRVNLSGANQRPRNGERLEFVVSHCDPTVVLHDVYHCVRGDMLVDVWRIDARGRL